MAVHVITQENGHFYRDQLEQHYKIRHKIFAERQDWKEIQRADKRDIDQFDNTQATNFVSLNDRFDVLGGFRFNPLSGDTLLRNVFGHLITLPLPAALQSGVDLTRLYTAPQSSGAAAQRAQSNILFCAMMEYALGQNIAFITFVSTIYMMEIGTSLGWDISPLGPPTMIEGKPTLPAWIRVDEKALENVRAKTGIERSVLLNLDEIDIRENFDNLTEGTQSLNC